MQVGADGFKRFLQDGGGYWCSRQAIVQVVVGPIFKHIIDKVINSCHIF